MTSSKLGERRGTEACQNTISRLAIFVPVLTCRTRVTCDTRVDGNNRRNIDSEANSREATRVERVAENLIFVKSTRSIFGKIENGIGNLKSMTIVRI